MNEITSKEVSAWLSRQAAEVHKTHPYAHICASLAQLAETPNAARFSIYCGPDISSSDKLTIEECLDELAGITPKSQADQLRSYAAELIGKADAIEAKLKLAGI